MDGDGVHVSTKANRRRALGRADNGGDAGGRGPEGREAQAQENSLDIVRRPPLAVPEFGMAVDRPACPADEVQLLA
jgi:hypothetical protein